MEVQVNERVAIRQTKRRAVEAKQQALSDAKAREQEQFERIKAEFGVDTAAVRYNQQNTDDKLAKLFWL